VERSLPQCHSVHQLNAGNHSETSAPSRLRTVYEQCSEFDVSGVSDPLESCSSIQHVPLLSLKGANQIRTGQSNVLGRDVWEDILRPASNTALNGFCLKYLPPSQFYEYLTRIAANRY
jgi:hypothetical protein